MNNIYLLISLHQSVLYNIYLYDEGSERVLGVGYNISRGVVGAVYGASITRIFKTKLATNSFTYTYPHVICTESFCLWSFVARDLEAAAD